MTSPQFLLLAAMAQERQPFLDAAESHSPAGTWVNASSELTDVVIDEVAGQILLTGIGPVAAATSLSAWFATRSIPRVVVSVGSAGGLAEHVAVGSVVIGTHFSYADVDARQFGYEFGQVPGMPATYTGAPVEFGLAEDHVHRGLLVTSSSFVGAELAEPMRQQFPDALAVDMESAALAQTCHLYGYDQFVSIRGISDLCTPRAGEDFHDGLGRAAERSFEMTRTLIRHA